MPVNQLIKNVGAVLTTVFVFALLVWALYFVFQDHGVAAQVGADGKVILDKFGNSKTTLLVILPLATSAAGYWLGNKGVADAKVDAKSAQTEKEALLSTSKVLPADTDLLSEARRRNPAAFGLNPDGTPRVRR